VGRAALRQVTSDERAEPLRRAFGRDRTDTGVLVISTLAGMAGLGKTQCGPEYLHPAID
jgi:hypothetical protein